MQRVDAASLELCRELYELSGWKTGSVYRDNPTESAYNEGNIIAYKYDLGYLLRRIPGAIVGTNPDGRGKALYSHFADDNRMYEQRADTPENALCQLAIALHRQNILKRDDGGSDD